MKNFLKIYSIAFQSLTLFWAGPYIDANSQEKSHAIALYPVVGLFVGIVLNLVYVFVRILLPESLVDFLIIMLPTLISGGLHIEGYAVILEKIKSEYIKRPTNEVGEIKSFSPSVSAFLVFSILLKFFFLSQVAPSFKTSVIILLPFVSHWVMALTCYSCKFIKRAPSGETDFCQDVGFVEIFLGALFSLGILFLFLKLRALPVIFIIFLSTIIAIGVSQKTNGLINRNALGFSHELSGILFLLTVLIFNPGLNE